MQDFFASSARSLNIFTYILLVRLNSISFLTWIEIQIILDKIVDEFLSYISTKYFITKISFLPESIAKEKEREKETYFGEVFIKNKCF